jgi:nucleoside-diphosphate-sugar epimerase
MSDMRVLLSGATGFLGRPALEALTNRGHEVLALSRQPAPMHIPAQVRWLESDLNQPDSYRTAVSDFAPQSALHLAWEGIPDFGLQTCLRNLTNGALLGEILFRAGCRHLAVSGSCWEYGKVSGRIAEGCQPVAPGIFAASKTSQRMLLESLAAAAGATLAWGRVFYPYGPGQKASSLAPTLCRAVIGGERPGLKTPAVVNDFLYVDDTAEALVLLAENPVTGVFNIGSGVGTPVGALADMLLQLGGRPAEFGSASQAAGEAAGFFADTSALKALGWRPRTSLEEGLRRTLEAFRRELPC